MLYQPGDLAFATGIPTAAFFTSHDARSGKEIYGRQRIKSEAGGFTSTPWAYNGKIFELSEEGWSKLNRLTRRQ